MYLKTIELNGFKSFANKTHLEITPGITGIVGPNGSGKSNIADALRWVLGEQSSKNLRGDKMEDVIFGGTAQRARKSFAEVTLVFDNADGKMKSEFSEITVSRKLYRSGESEYRINGKLVRLRDVLELVRDTGIGKEGYSIIGQGRIDEILSSKPQARRKVFEEAAGIMKFRVRKEEAEAKLEKTADNLTRVEDILGELNNQLEPMRVQAERAKKYFELAETQRTLDAVIYAYNYEKYAEREKKLKEEYDLLDGEMAGLQKRLDSEARAAEEAQLRLSELTEQVGALSEERSALRANCERIQGEMNLQAERRANAQQRAETIQRNRANSEDALKNIEKEIEDTRKELSEGELKEKKAKAELEKAQRDYTEHTELRKDAERSLAKLRARQVELLGELSDVRGQLAQAKEQARTEAERTQRSAEEILRARDEAQKAAEIREQIEKQMETLAKETETAAAELNELTGQKLNLAREKSELENHIRSLERQASERGTQLKMLTGMKEEYEGYYESVKRLMNYAARDPELSDRMIGTVAELVRTPAEYEQAIEAALGGALQNVIVHDEYDAKYAINILRQKRMGRVTFLPLAALRQQHMSASERRYMNMPGVVCAANEAVEYPAEIEKAINFLLARTVIVEDMDSGIQLMRASGQALRCVTLQGDILRPGGTMTGGSTGKNRYGLVSRERKIEDAKNALSETQEQLHSLKKRADSLLAKEGQTAEKQSEAQSALREKEIQRAALEQSLKTAQETETSARNALERLEELPDEKTAERLNARAENFAARETALEQELTGIERSLEQTSPLDDGVSERLNDRVRELGIELAETSAKRKSAAERLSRLETELLDARRTAQDSDSELQKLTERTEESKQAESALAQSLSQEKQKLAAREEELSKLEKEQKAAQDASFGAQKRSSEIQEEKAALSDRVFSVRGQMDKVKYARENAAQKLFNEYSITYGNAKDIRDRTDISFAKASSEITGIKAAIRELGGVNPSAPEEYEILKQRSDDMTAQREDLLKAKEDLETLIDKLMTGMRTSFKDSFEKINEHFGKIFGELFGGGTAKLTLGEGDIMSCGIDISAVPPGKKLQNITLLSGGEKALTAIALTFAMIKINPSPVCLLDEIDAPLDEANVHRLAQYLKGMPESQFVVITHRKPTMAVCDVLYGVAMGEKGVSGMVSVDMQS